jgi:hypothetical protein
VTENTSGTFVIDPPSSELERLTPLLGRWQTQAQTEDSILGPGVTVTSLEEFYWLDGGYFLVQTYETIFGNESPQRGINYWFLGSLVARAPLHLEILVLGQRGRTRGRTALVPRGRWPAATHSNAAAPA